MKIKNWNKKIPHNGTNRPSRIAIEHIIDREYGKAKKANIEQPMMYALRQAADFLSNVEKASDNFERFDDVRGGFYKREEEYENQECPKCGCPDFYLAKGQGKTPIWGFALNLSGQIGIFCVHCDTLLRWASKKEKVFLSCELNEEFKIKYYADRNADGDD